MKVKKPGIWSILLVFLIITSIVVILIIPTRQALVFEYQNTGDVLAFLPLSEQSTFKMKYTHSIHLSDVIESYRFTEENEIKQYELMYEDFAIGMPENAAKGEVFEQKDGKYYIKNMNRVFPYFDLRVGKVRANHTIIFNNKEYPLAHYVEPGTWIRIKADKLNLLQQLKGVNMLDG
ncbi:DUF1850 domain-containing protein [Cytobacillus gottheilii]|uniref:DUF1850 domain-containing protein n=1 Tax=Cytobacillus gottheilii TaxID=859144 RepID=UPI0009BBA378|nr:DUF1850 domain-containing protein [Cytobacillus gottheilii]